MTDDTNVNDCEVSDEPETSQESKPTPLFVRVVVLALLIAGLAFGAHLYADTLSRAIPEPYAKQISDLNADRREIMKKRQDLEKEIAGLNAQEQWDCQRQGVIAAQALQSLRLDGVQYIVNIDSMEIVHRPR